MVSVVIPIYNVEKYLEQCLKSVCAQTYTNLEIILIDDGSPDRSYRIYQEYVNIDKRIQVIKQENKGLSSARNIGFKATKGEYILFIDSDSFISPYMIEKLLIAAVASEADFSFCNYIYVDEDGNNRRLASGFPIEEDYLGEEILECICLGKYDWLWSVVWNRLYKREFISGFRFAEGKIHEDEFHLHEVLLSTPKMQAVNEGLYFYRIRSNSIIQGKYSLKKYDRVKTLLSRSKAMWQAKCKPQANLIVLKSVLGELKKSFSTLDFKDARVKKRYRELISQYMWLFIRYIIPSTDISWKEKIYLILTTIAPYTRFKLMR